MLCTIEKSWCMKIFGQFLKFYYAPWFLVYPLYHLIVNPAEGRDYGTKWFTFVWGKFTICFCELKRVHILGTSLNLSYFITKCYCDLHVHFLRIPSYFITRLHMKQDIIPTAITLPGSLPWHSTYSYRCGNWLDQHELLLLDLKSNAK